MEQSCVTSFRLILFDECLLFRRIRASVSVLQSSDAVPFCLLCAPLRRNSGGDAALVAVEATLFCAEAFLSFDGPDDYLTNSDEMLKKPPSAPIGANCAIATELLSDEMQSQKQKAE